MIFQSYTLDYHDISKFINDEHVQQETVILRF